MVENVTNGFDMATFINSALEKYNNDGFGGNNGFFWIFFLLLLYGRNGGWGNDGGCNCNGNAAAINDAVEAAIAKGRANDLSDKIVLEAVNGNRTAIAELSSKLNCDVNAIQTALGQLGTAIQSVGNQVGLSSQQIINAVQMGNQNIMQQMSSCCCDLKGLVIEKSNAAVIQNMQQTTELTGVMNAGFALMGNRFNEQAIATTKGFQEIKDLLNQSKIDALQEKVTQLQNAADNAAQTAYMQNYVTGLVTPLQATINCINSKVPPVPVPTYPAPQYASGYAYNIVPTSNCAGGCNCNCGA